MWRRRSQDCAPLPGLWRKEDGNVAVDDDDKLFLLFAVVSADDDSAFDDDDNDDNDQGMTVCSHYFTFDLLPHRKIFNFFFW